MRKTNLNKSNVNGNLESVRDRLRVADKYDDLPEKGDPIEESTYSVTKCMFVCV